MQKLYTLIVCLGLLTCSLTVKGQETDYPHENVRNFVPATPEAASLGIYGAVPVNQSNGLPQIEVPLYTLNHGDLSVPISLNYHSAGNKVEEIASSVGLGWSIAAGGLITRTVRGLPDEQSNVGYFALQQRLINGEFESNLDKQRIHSGEYDSEPDLYFYNFLGFSGELIIKDGVISTNPASDLKFTFNSTNSVYEVLLPNGVQCTFGFVEGYGAIDSSKRYNENQEPPPARFDNTAWYLAQVISPYGENKINFSYIQENIAYASGYAETKYQLDPPYQTLTSGGQVVLECTNITNARSHAIYEGSQSRLSKIEGGTQQINFILSSDDRLDLPGSKQLTQINIDVNGNAFDRKIFFHQTYFESADKTSGYSPADAYRLRLNGVTIGEGGDQQTYSFTYNESEVPNRQSLSQDLWGYFNGKSNTTLIPKYQSLPDGKMTVYSYGSDRSVDATKAGWGILQKVVYPTGGYTEFVFEPNEYAFIGKRISSMQQNPPYVNEAVEKITEEFNLGAGLRYGKRDDSRSFTLPKGGIVDLSASFRMQVDYEPMAVSIILSKLNDTGASEIVFSLTNGECTGSTCAKAKNEEVYLEEGNYLLELTADYINSSNYAEASAKVIYPIGEIRIDQTAGGFRIKEVKTNSLYSAEVVKTYTYEGADGFSSGILTNDLLFAYPYKNKIRNQYGGLECQYIGFLANAQASANASSNHQVSYSRVTEHTLEGKVVSNFSSILEYPDIVSIRFPFQTIKSFQQLRGNLLSREIYSKNGDLVKTENRIYGFLDNSPVFSINDIGGNYQEIQEGYLITLLSNATSLEEQVFDTQTYMEGILTPKLLEEGSVLYLNDQDFTTQTYLKYDRIAGHQQVVEKRIYNSNDKYKGTRFHYPIQQYSEQDQLLYVANMLNKPLSITEFIVSEGGVEKLVKKNLFSYEENENTIPMLIGIQEEVGSGSANDLRELYKVNRSISGRVLEDEKDGIRRAYTYSPIYPSQVNSITTDASFDQVLYFDFEDEANTATNAHTGMGSYTGSLTLQRPTTDGSYVLSYWEYTNGEWKKYTQNFSSTSVTLTGTIDDIRIHPEGAIMETYTYYEEDMIRSFTDGNGNVKYYQYDSLKRLTSIRDEQGNIENQISYQLK